MKLDEGTLKKVIKDLSTPPRNAMKLMEVIRDPATESKEVEDLLRYEPGLTANLLRMANSAYFALPQRIGSVRQAIVTLGLKRVADLVMVSCLNSIMGVSVEGYGLEKGELRNHSIAVAVTSELLIKELNLPRSDEIFTASLLHDVGKLVLGHFVKDAPTEAFYRGNEAFDEIEREVSGYDHGYVGAEVLKAWGFPEAMVNAVRFHHYPDECPADNMIVDVLHVCDMICLMLGFTAGKEGLKYKSSSNAAKRLNLSVVAMERAASYTMEKMNHLLEGVSKNQDQR